MPRKHPKMSLMPIEQQLEVQQRLENRRVASEAVDRLEAALNAFLDNDNDTFKALIATFKAVGHKGQYLENPNVTARRRQLAAQVEAKLKETPLNWMRAVELSYNVRRMEKITDILSALAPGDATIKQILQTYQQVGVRFAPSSKPKRAIGRKNSLGRVIE